MWGDAVPHRRGYSRCLVVVASALAALGAGVGPGTGLASGDAGRLLIDDQRFAIASGDEVELRFTLDVALAGDETVEVTVHRSVATVDELERLEDTIDALDATDVGSTLDAASVQLADLLDPEASAPTAILAMPIEIVDAAGAEGATDVAADDTGDASAAPSLVVPAAGIYPLTIGVDGDDATVSATTVIAVHDPDAPGAWDAQLAILAGIDDPGRWPTPSERAAAEDALDAAIALGAAVDAPLSLRLPPRLLAAGRDEAPGSGDTNPGDPAAGDTEPGDAPSGDTDPADDADDARSAVATTFAGDDLVAVPTISLDPAAAAGAGADLFFTRQLVAGEAITASAAPLAVRGRSVWVATTPLTRPAATLLRTVGVQLVVVTPAVAETLGLGGGDGAVFAIATDGDLALAGLVAHPLGEWLAEPADGATTAATRAALTAAAVLLAAAETSGGPIALATADVGLPDSDVTAAFARFVGEHPQLDVVGASALTTPAGVELAGGAGGASIELPPTGGDDLTDRMESIDSVRDDVVHVRSMLQDPAAADAWDAELDELLATTVDDETAAAHLAATSGEIAELFGAIEPPEPFTYTLTGTSSELPLTVTNGSEHDVEVVLRVRSSRLDPVDHPVVVPAGEEASVRVPVRARSGGSFSVEVTVHTPDGLRISDPIGGRASVTRITGLSQVLTGGAILVLASWWFHHLRRNRSRTAAHG